MQAMLNIYLHNAIKIAFLVMVRFILQIFFRWVTVFCSCAAQSREIQRQRWMRHTEADRQSKIVGRMRREDEQGRKERKRGGKSREGRTERMREETTAEDENYEISPSVIKALL